MRVPMRTSTAARIIQYSEFIHSFYSTVQYVSCIFNVVCKKHERKWMIDRDKQQLQKLRYCIFLERLRTKINNDNRALEQYRLTKHVCERQVSLQYLHYVTKRNIYKLPSIVLGFISRSTEC